VGDVDGQGVASEQAAVPHEQSRRRVRGRPAVEPVPEGREQDQHHPQQKEPHAERLRIERQRGQVAAGHVERRVLRAGPGGEESREREQPPDEHQERGVVRQAVLRQAPADDEADDGEDDPGEDGELPGEEESEDVAEEGGGALVVLHGIEEEVGQVVGDPPHIDKRPAVERGEVHPRAEPRGDGGDGGADQEQRPGAQKAAEEQDDGGGADEGEDVPDPQLLVPLHEEQEQQAHDENGGAPEQHPARVRRQLARALARGQDLAHPHQEHEPGSREIAAQRVVGQEVDHRLRSLAARQVDGIMAEHHADEGERPQHVHRVHPLHGGASLPGDLVSCHLYSVAYCDTLLSAGIRPVGAADEEISRAFN